MRERGAATPVRSEGGAARREPGRREAAQREWGAAPAGRAALGTGRRRLEEQA
jgi:hypothetical protein